MSKIRYHIVAANQGFIVTPQYNEPSELAPDRMIMGRLMGASMTSHGAFWRVNAETTRLSTGERDLLITLVVADQRLDDILPMLIGSSIRITGDGSVWCAYCGSNAGEYVRVVSVNEVLNLVTARAIDYQTAWDALGAPGALGREAAMARVVDAMKRQTRAE